MGNLLALPKQSIQLELSFKSDFPLFSLFQLQNMRAGLGRNAPSGGSPPQARFPPMDRTQRQCGVGLEAKPRAKHLPLQSQGHRRPHVPRQQRAAVPREADAEREAQRRLTDAEEEEPAGQIQI